MMTNQLENIVQQLQEWSQQQDLIEQALEGCRTSLRNWEAEEKKAGRMAPWEVSDIQLRFDHQSLVFKHDVLSYPYVSTRIGLYITPDSKIWFRNLEPIGHYRLITTLDGQIDDDYLVFDSPYEHS